MQETRPSNREGSRFHYRDEPLALLLFGFLAAGIAGLGVTAVSLKRGLLVSHQTPVFFIKGVAVGMDICTYLGLTGPYQRLPIIEKDRESRCE